MDGSKPTKIWITLLRLVQWILCWKKSWVQKCCSKIMIILRPFIMDHTVPFQKGSLCKIQLLRLVQWDLCWNHYWVQKSCSKIMITLYSFIMDHSYSYGSPFILWLWYTLSAVSMGHPASCGHWSPCIICWWITLYSQRIETLYTSSSSSKSISFGLTESE